MADTLVDSSVAADADSSEFWGPYWIDESIGLIVYVNSDADIEFARTIDKGTNWTLTEITAGTVEKISCWFDQETPGDTGTLVHCAWADSDNDDILYRTVDVSDASLGTQRTVAQPTAVNVDSSRCRVCITKSRDGNLYVGFIVTDGAAGENDFLRSVDSGANWTSRAQLFDDLTSQPDHSMLFPANTADESDICALYWDHSANDISIKMYDDSSGASGAWTETDIDTDAAEDSIHVNMDGVIRHSDKHLLMAFHSNDDTAGDDLRCYDITVDSIAIPTVTSKTNIFTNQNEAAQVGMMINQQNDDVYLAYLKGGTWTGSVDVVYHLSDDDLATWEVEEAYSEAAADDNRRVTGGRTVGDGGGRWQPVWYNDDLFDLYVNEVNDVEIAAVAVSDSPDASFRKTRQNIQLRM